ncbi:hypothetical protein EDB83DRAFT_2325587 [Lactarius deliciosus]|nr:hypothetical protein EDB83DRAFT_2325587 [Lactarius deliciosus]
MEVCVPVFVQACLWQWPFFRRESRPQKGRCQESHVFPVITKWASPNNIRAQFVLLLSYYGARKREGAVNASAGRPWALLCDAWGGRGGSLSCAPFRANRLRGKGTVAPSRPRSLIAACPRTTPFRANGVAQTWGKGKGRRGTRDGERCALVRPFRGNGVARERERGAGRGEAGDDAKRRGGARRAPLLRANRGRVGSGVTCCARPLSTRTGGAAKGEEDRSEATRRSRALLPRVQGGTAKGSAGDRVPSCAPLPREWEERPGVACHRVPSSRAYRAARPRGEGRDRGDEERGWRTLVRTRSAQMGRGREREGAEETWRRTACCSAPFPANGAADKGRGGRGWREGATACPRMRPFHANGTAGTWGKCRRAFVRSLSAQTRRMWRRGRGGGAAYPRAPPLSTREGVAVSAGRRRGDLPSCAPLDANGAARDAGEGGVSLLSCVPFSTQMGWARGAGGDEGSLYRTGERFGGKGKGPVRTPWRKQNVPAMYAYVAGTFSSRTPPPPAPHAHLIRVEKVTQEGRLTPFPFLCIANKMRAHEGGAQGKSPTHPFPLPPPPPLRAQKGGAYEGMLPTLPFPSLTSAAPRLRGMSAKACPPSSFSPAPPFTPRSCHPVRAEGGARRHTAPPPLGTYSSPMSTPPVRAERERATPALSPSPPAPSFPLIRAAPFVRKECTRAHRPPLPFPRHPVPAEGAHEGTPLTVPRPPSALTLPPCPRHPVRAEWGRARASRYEAARTGRHHSPLPAQPVRAERGARERTAPASPRVAQEGPRSPCARINRALPFSRAIVRLGKK